MELTRSSDKKRIGININTIKYIVEYESKAKIQCIREDGTFFQDFYVEEDVSTVCDKINKVSEKNLGTINIFHKQSIFK